MYIENINYPSFSGATQFFHQETAVGNPSQTPKKRTLLNNNQGHS